MVLTEKFEVHDTLNPKLWTSDNKLLDDVKVKIVEIIEQFVSTCDIPINVVDAHLVGSNASYNYTSHSDLDVHIITNFELVEASKEILQTLYNALKAKFNSDYDISIHGVDVELYVEDIRSSALSNGVYSLYYDKWLKFPKKLDSVPQVDITAEFAEWKQKFETAIKSDNSDNITSVINDIYLLRKTSLDTEGEYGKGNQVFKEIRNAGLLDATKDAYKRCRSKELTLEKLQLHEESRTRILARSKQSKKGFERFRKRVKSRVANSVKQFNAMDMNKLFKQDVFSVDVMVRGETDTYAVTISFGGFLELLQDQLKTTELNLKAVTRALINGFNREDVYISCTCPDNQYRYAFSQTQHGIKSGEQETRPANITNPHDDLGASCKHILLVLSNQSWLLKCGSTILNYIRYMEKHYEHLYQTVIYPAIYKKEYEGPVQLSLFDDERLITDKDELDKSNTYARTKNQFKQGNEYRFKPGPDKNQISLDEQPENSDSALDDNIT